MVFVFEPAVKKNSMVINIAVIKILVLISSLFLFRPAVDSGFGKLFTCLDRLLLNYHPKSYLASLSLSLFMGLFYIYLGFCSSIEFK